MLIKEETKTIYTASDGTEFFKIDEAIEYQIRLNLKMWADRVGLCRGGEWDEDLVIDAIMDTKEDFKNILLFEKFMESE